MGATGLPAEGGTITDHTSQRGADPLSLERCRLAYLPTTRTSPLRSCTIGVYLSQVGEQSVAYQVGAERDGGVGLIHPKDLDFEGVRYLRKSSLSTSQHPRNVRECKLVAAETVIFKIIK